MQLVYIIWIYIYIIYIYICTTPIGQVFIYGCICMRLFVHKNQICIQITEYTVWCLDIGICTCALTYTYAYIWVIAFLYKYIFNLQYAYIHFIDYLSRLKWTLILILPTFYIFVLCRGDFSKRREMRKKIFLRI